MPPPGLRHEVKLSYRDVRKVFSGLRHALRARLGDGLQPPRRTGLRLHEDPRQGARLGRRPRRDAPGVGGKSAFLWAAGNGATRGSLAIRMSPSPSSSAFAGNLVADGYAAYNAVNLRRRQAWLAHLKRKARETAERIALPERLRTPSLRFCKALEAFFPLLLPRRQTEKRGHALLAAYAPLRKSPARDLPASLADADAENLRQRLTDPKRDAPNLFSFFEVAASP